MLTLRRLSVVRHMEGWSRKLFAHVVEDKGCQVQGLTVGAAAACVGAEGGERKFPVWPGSISIHTSSLTTKFCLPVQVCCSTMVPRGTTIRTAVAAGVVNLHAHGVGVVVAVAHNGLNLDLSGVGGVVEAVGAGLVGHVQSSGGVDGGGVVAGTAQVGELSEQLSAAQEAVVVDHQVGGVDASCLVRRKRGARSPVTVIRVRSRRLL